MLRCTFIIDCLQKLSSMRYQSLLTYFQSRKWEILDVVRQFVTFETPSTDKTRLDAFARADGGTLLPAAGALTEIIANAHGGNHLRACLAQGATAAKPASALCHYDTVWPAGSLATHPFRIEDGKAYGPGIYDMQTSLALVEFALAAVRDLGLDLPRPITVLVTSDEEVGSDDLGVP